MLTAKDLQNLLPEFIDHLVSTNSSRSTIKNYAADLRRVLENLPAETQVDSSHISAALETLKASFSESTLRRFSYSLKAFTLWLSSQGHNLTPTVSQLQTPVAPVVTPTPVTKTNISEDIKVSPIQTYVEHIKDQGAPETTTKQYRSDLNSFFAWLKPAGSSINQKVIEHVSRFDINRYTSFLKSKQVSPASINRYLYSLKDFFNFSKADIVYETNPVRVGSPSNQPDKHFWERFKLKKPRWWHAYRGHPISDYTNWAALAVVTLFIGLGLYQNLFPQKVVQLAQNNSGIVLGSAAPPRVLSFQGRMTNASGTPIVVGTSVSFNIYNVDSGGSPLWTSKAWTITPDQNGIMSACLGDTTTSDICLSGNSGGSPPYTADNAIAANLFTDNPSLYLGVTMGGDPEATPRQRIASATYALNAGALNSSFSSATNNDFGNSISATNASTTGSVTINGIVITPTGTSTIGTNTINLVNFATPVTPNSNNFYGLNFATGYTDILRYNSTQLISGTGATGSGLTLALGTSTVSGTLGLSNGGTNNNITAANGQVVYSDASKMLLTTSGSTGNCLTYNSGSAPTWNSCLGSGVRLDQVTSATATPGSPLTSGDWAQTWDWSLTTASKSAFTIGENTAGTATGTPYLVNIQTLNTSTVNPLVVTAQGTANGIKVNTAGLLSAIGTGGINATQLLGATWASPGNIGTGTPGSGAFTTLTSNGATTLGTGTSLTNTFGSGASSINTIGSATTPGTLTLLGSNFSVSTVGAIAAATTTNTINNLIFNGSGTISGTLTTLTPSGAFTVGSTGQTLTLQGSSTSLTATSGGITNTLNFVTPVTPGKTIQIPNEAGVLCIQASTNCSFAPSSGSGNYLSKVAADSATVASAGTNLYSFQNTSTTSGSNGILVTTPAVGAATPTITGISSTTGTLGGAGIQNAYLATLGTPTAGTVNGFNFQNVSTNNASVNAINIGTETKSGSGTATAINISSGWDKAISITLANPAADTANALYEIGNYGPAAGITDNMNYIDVTHSITSNSIGTGTVNGFNFIPRLNVAGTESKVLNSIYTSAPSIAGVSGGAVYINGMTVNPTPSSADALITSNGFSVSPSGGNINLSGISAGTLNGVNIAGITAGAGTENAINIGSGWDSAVKITGTTSQTTQQALVVSGYSYAHATGESTDLNSISFTDASATTSGTTTTNGLKISLTDNNGNNTAGTSVVTGLTLASAFTTTGATATKEIDAINIPAPTSTSCTGGACTWNGINLTLAAAAANTTQTGLLLNADNLTTGDKGVSITSTNAGLTTGTLLNISSATTGAVNASNGAVRISSTGAFSTGPFVNINSSANYSGTLVGIVSDTLSTGGGKALSITDSNAGLTTGTLLNVSSASTGTINAANGVVNIASTGAFSTGPFVNINSNANYSGTLVGIVSNSLTTGGGIALSVTDSNAGLTTSTLLNVNSATTGAVNAANGVVKITSSGAFSTGPFVNISSSANYSGTLVGIVSDTLSTGGGIALSVTDSNAGLTTGTLLNVSSGSTGAINASNGAVRISATGAFSTGPFVNINSSGNYTGTFLGVTGTTSTAGTLASFTNNTASFTGTGTNISFNGLTSGTGLAVATGSSAGLTTGSSISNTTTFGSGNAQIPLGLSLVLTDNSTNATTGGFTGISQTVTKGTAGTGTGAKRGLSLVWDNTAYTTNSSTDLIFGSVQQAASNSYNLLHLRSGSTLGDVTTINGYGDIRSGFTQLSGTTTTNGAGTASTTLILTSAAGFTIGNYVQVNSTACVTGVNICYAKITNIVTNTLTISPSLTWANAATVNQYHIPEVGGNDNNGSPTLTSRFGQAWFINGITTGNGSTNYTDASINQDAASSTFNFLDANTTTLNIGVSGLSTTLNGSLNVTGGVSGTGTSSINTSGSANTNIGTGTNTGTITIGNSTSTAIKLGKFATANGVLFVSATDGTLSETGVNAGTIQCLTQTSSAAPGWATCPGGGGGTLDTIAAAAAPQTGILSGDNQIVWNWQLTTASKSAFTFGENVASAATGTPYLVNIQTKSTSTVNPLIVTAGGTANGVKVDTTGLLSAIGTGGINATQLGGATFAAPGSIGSGTPGSGAFTTLTSNGATTLGTGTSLTNTFGSGATSTNTIGSSTTPGVLTLQGSALTLHGAATLDNTFTVSGTNLTSLGGGLTVTGTAWTATPTISGLITASSGVSIANGQSYTGAGTVTLSSGGSSALTLSSASSHVTLATGNFLNSSISGVTGATAGDIWYDTAAGKFKINETTGGTKTLCNLTDTGCGAGGAGPFTSSGGIIDYTTSTDRLRLRIGATGTIGLNIQGFASQTANFIQIDNNTTDTQPIFALDSAGRFNFGVGGSTATDTQLFRSGANTISLGTTTSLTAAGTLTIDSNTTNALNVGNGASAKTITIGSTSATKILMEAGTGTAGISIAAGNTVHDIDIGSGGTSTAQTITIGSSGSTSSTLTLEAGTAATAIQIGNGATAHGIQIGTGGAVQTIVIGSNNTTSEIMLNGGNYSTTTGTGGVHIGSDVADTNLVQFQVDTSSTYSETANTCSTTVNQGALYYNSTAGVMRGCINGQWEDMTSTASFGLQLLGVVPDSGPDPGNWVGINATMASNGPCKVYMGSATTAIRWTACTAYSGGRKVLVAAQASDVAVTTTNGNFQHLCLTGTNSAPALSASGTEVANLPAFSAAAPILCLADIKTSSTAVTAIYDVRTFTTTTKEIVNNITTAAALGMEVQQTTTVGSVTRPAATAGLAFQRGVFVVTAGGTTANQMNAIIATAGPAYMKATAGTVQGFVETGGTTAGYVITTATLPTTGYGTLGLALSTFSSTCGANADACRTSLAVDLHIR